VEERGRLRVRGRAVRLEHLIRRDLLVALRGHVEEGRITEDLGGDLWSTTDEPVAEAQRPARAREGADGGRDEALSPRVVGRIEVVGSFDHVEELAPRHAEESTRARRLARARPTN
jgi:hypothetical protein